MAEDLGFVGVEEQERPVTQLDFDQAMKDFSTMFPEMDRDVIEEVLRANQGAVDATIDQLLAMSTDTINEEILRQTSLPPPDVVGGEKKPNEDEQAPMSVVRGWCPPLVGPLPQSFLRIDESQLKLAQNCLEDERIALFLQNEEFLSELRINPEFLSALDEDTNRPDGSSDLDSFKERLRHMGKLSRNKFTQLARVFQRRKKTRGKALLEQNAAGEALLGSEPFDEPNRQ